MGAPRRYTKGFGLVVTAIMDEALEKEAQRLQLTKAEIVRRALDKYLPHAARQG
jgi:hypothetical protein